MHCEIVKYEIWKGGLNNATSAVTWLELEELLHPLYGLLKSYKENYMGENVSLYDHNEYHYDL